MRGRGKIGCWGKVNRKKKKKKKKGRLIYLRNWRNNPTKTVKCLLKRRWLSSNSNRKICISRPETASSNDTIAI